MTSTFVLFTNKKVCSVNILHASCSGKIPTGELLLSLTFVSVLLRALNVCKRHFCWDTIALGSWRTYFFTYVNLKILQSPCKHDPLFWTGRCSPLLLHCMRKGLGRPAFYEGPWMMCIIIRGTVLCTLLTITHDRCFNFCHKVLRQYGFPWSTYMSNMCLYIL